MFSLFNVKSFPFFYLEPVGLVDSLEEFKYCLCWLFFATCYGRFIFWLVIFFYFCIATVLDFLSIFRIHDVHEAREDHLLFFEFFLYLVKAYGVIFLGYYSCFVFFFYFIFPFLVETGFDVFGGFLFFCEYFVFSESFL